MKMIGHPVSDMLRKHFEINQTIEMEGIILTLDKSNLTEGDTYIAGRNTGPHLLTVKEVIYNELGNPDFVIPKEQNKYFYDIGECYKITL